MLQRFKIHNNFMPVISIVVPIFNADRCLERCLHSIKAQSYDEYEVLLVDDGSTDSSAAICESFCKNDDRFIYLYQENAGPDIARKTGTKNARGEYIAYVDSDDYIAYDMLEKEHDAILRTGADIVCSQIIRFDEKREWSGSLYHDEVTLLTDKQEILRAFFETGILIGTYYAKLIKTSIMKNYDFITDGLIGEDITAALYMFDKAKTISLIPDKTYYYYQNSDSISHAKYSHRHFVSLDNYIKLRDLYLNRDGVTPKRICGYFAAYQMAVATAMGRKGYYEKEPGELLRNDLKDHWKWIKNDSKTALNMKMCIWLYMYMPKVFIGMFHMLYVFTGR